MRKATLVRAAAAGLALTFVAAACGDDSGSSAATTAAAAATTAAGAATTAAGAATTAAAGGETLKVDTANCPADATAELAAGADITIGSVIPQSGPLAAFGAIAQGLNTYFAKVNADGGSRRPQARAGREGRRLRSRTRRRHSSPS